MKRKRGCGKRKPKLVSATGSKEAFPNVVTLNTQDEFGLDDFDNAEFDSRMETETRQNGSNGSREQAGLQKQKVVDVTREDSMSSFPEMNASVSANLSKKARSIMTKSSRGFASSNMKPSSNTEQVQAGRTHQKEPNLPRQDLQYEEQELKSALVVIRKVMKMDAAEPFNVPVDSVALGIPDYFDVIGTPMDFGTICSNLENGVKYKSSKDVLGDVQYIWDNCCKYNKKGHYILELMKRVKKNFIKLWTEAGLYEEQQQDIDGHPHLPPTKSTVRCSMHGHRSPVGSMTDNARHQQQNQVDASGLQPHLPSLSYSQSCQPQQRPCQCQLCSGQQHTSQPQAGTNVGNAVLQLLQFKQQASNTPAFKTPGHSHLPPPIESTMRRRLRGHKCPVGPTADNPTCLQPNQIGQNQPQLHQHQPSISCSQPYQPQQGSCQCHPSSGQQQPSQPLAGTDIANEGHFYSPPPEESMIRCTKRVTRCPVGPMTDYISHQQQDHIAPIHMQPQQLASCNGQPHQPQQGTCQGQLSSSQLHPIFGQPQPSQPQAVVEMGSAGQFYSPPAAESMIRCTKRGPRDPAGPMTDYISCQQQDQITTSQMQPHQPPLRYSLPHQPHQGTCQGQLSSSLPQPSQPQAAMDMCTADSSSIRRKTRGRGGRGPTRCLKVWNTEGKIPIDTNELGQPIGLEAPKLTSFLGTIARNGHVAPLNYVDWRAVPDENKEQMWQQVQTKFDIDPKSKSWVLKSLGTKWKNWKAELKTSHYNLHETEEEQLADCDERVLPDQWRILVSFWNSKEAKERSVKNKANRAQQKISHTTGTKSFARVREEQRAKRPDGKEPSRAELFILTRTRKDGRPVNEASSVIISQLRERANQRQGTSQNGNVEDDVFFQIMGQDRHGRVRTYGLGPAPSDIGGPKPNRAEVMQMVSEANAEVCEVKEKMVVMEQTCAQMAAQMATMMSMMSTMQRNLTDKHMPNVVGSPSEPLHAGQVAAVSSNSEGSQQVPVHSSSFRQGVPSVQTSAMKRGKKQNTRIGKVTRKRR